MKVLHVINTLSAGGAELHLLTLCRHLKQQGLEVVVAFFKNQGRGSRMLVPEFENEGIRVIHLDLEGPRTLLFLPIMRDLLRAEAPDVLHTHLPRADFAGWGTRWLSPSLVWVSSVHGIYAEHWRGRWTLPVFKLVWRRADAVVAISGAVKEWLVRRQKVFPDKVTVIHYGIEPEQFAGAGSEASCGASPDRPIVVGAVGRLIPIKGHETLIRAMALVQKQNPNVVLLIAGHDSIGYGARLRALIDELGLQSRVKLVGFENDVPSFLRQIHIFAHPSWAEGFGQAVIEAMAAGKPAIVSRISPLDEIVSHEETGLLAEAGNASAFAEAISSLIMYPADAQRMGENARLRVRQYFNAERMTQETLSLYKLEMAKKTKQ